MGSSGVWGTEVEVLAFASMVNTTVYVYGPVGQNVYKWMPYRPLDGIQPNVQVLAPTAGCIYLKAPSHQTSSHYVLENVAKTGSNCVRTE